MAFRRAGPQQHSPNCLHDFYTVYDVGSGADSSAGSRMFRHASRLLTGAARFLLNGMGSPNEKQVLMSALKIVIASAGFRSAKDHLTKMFPDAEVYAIDPVTLADRPL